MDLREQLRGKGRAGPAAKPLEGVGPHPRASAISGIPLEDSDQIVLLYANPWGIVATVSVEATIYYPLQDRSAAGVVAGLQGVDITSGSSAFSQKLPAGSVLCGIGLPSSSSSNPCGFFVEVWLFRSGQPYQPLCEGWVYDRHIPGWPQAIVEHGRANVAEQGAVVSLDITFVNNGANSGDQVVVISGGAGGRFRDLLGRILNGDTAARNASVYVDDGVTIIYRLLAATASAVISIAAGAECAVPNNAANFLAIAAGGNYLKSQIVAGAQRVVSTLAAVAINENSEQLYTLLAWGNDPAVTESAPAGCTITVVNHRVEAG